MKNNPIRYVDPTGHFQVEDPGNDPCTYIACQPSYTPPRPKPQSDESDIDDDDDSEGLGEFITAYNGFGGESVITGIHGLSGLDGECADFADPKGCSAVSISGGDVPLKYFARYDVILYENLLTVTIHEYYLIPSAARPLYEIPTFGNSVILIRSGLQQSETILGNFLPGNIEHPENPTRRSTPLYFHGKENFPDQLVIRVRFGAPGLGSKTFYYPLPYTKP